MGRFISEDPIGFDGGINFYAYVENNPVLMNEPSGKIAPLVVWGVGCALNAACRARVGFVVGGVTGFASQVGSNYITGGSSTTAGYTAAALGGATEGAILGFSGGASLRRSSFAGSAGGFVEATTENALNWAGSDEAFDFEAWGTDAVIKTGSGAMLAGFGGPVNGPSIGDVNGPDLLGFAKDFGPQDAKDWGTGSGIYFGIDVNADLGSGVLNNLVNDGYKGIADLFQSDASTSGGFVLYPNKLILNQSVRVYSK